MSQFPNEWTMGTSQSWFWEMTVGLGWGSSSHMIVVHKAGALSHSQDFLNPHPPILSLTYPRTCTKSSISPNGAPNNWNLELGRLQDAISQVGKRYRRWYISSGSSISHVQWSIRKRKFICFLLVPFMLLHYLCISDQWAAQSRSTSKTTTLCFSLLIACLRSIIRKFALDIQTRPTRSTNASAGFKRCVLPQDVSTIRYFLSIKSGSLLKHTLARSCLYYVK